MNKPIRNDIKSNNSNRISKIHIVQNDFNVIVNIEFTLLSNFIK